MYLRYTTWCFDVHIHCEMIAATKLINISVTSHSYHFFSSIIDVISFTEFLLKVKSHFQAPKLMFNMGCWHIPQSGEGLLWTARARHYFPAPGRSHPSPLLLISSQLESFVSMFTTILYHKRKGVWKLGSTVTVSSRHCTNTNRFFIWALPGGYAIFIQQTINNREQGGWPLGLHKRCLFS